MDWPRWFTAVCAVDRLQPVATPRPLLAQLLLALPIEGDQLAYGHPRRRFSWGPGTVA